MKKQPENNQTGFTLVELLIVIVVIAILAAISIVAYNGIQDRAKQASLTSAITAYQKGLELYRAANGNYPALGASPTECLGVEGDLPATANHPVDRCAFAHYTDLRNDTLNDALKPYMSTAPSVSHNQEFRSASGRYYRGVYFEGNANYYYIEYVIKSGESCPVGVETYSDPGYFTMCYLRTDI